MLNENRHALARLTGHALLVVLAGCGGGDDDPEMAGGRAAPSTTLSACDLITRAELDAIVGPGLGEPERAGSQCTMEGDTSQNDYRTLVLDVAELVNPEARIADMAAWYEPGDAVPELGTKAYYSASQLMMVARSHQILITLGVFGRENFDVREATIQLARAMIPRLPT
jgi:hypothetical protein